MKRLDGLRIAMPMLLAACTSLSKGVAPPQKEAIVAAPATKPALVVLVVIDQLRESLLERYDNLFTGGFRRLMDDGHYFVNATHDHSATETAPGHSALGTGVYPSHSGIIGNLWYEKTGTTWTLVSNVGDSTVQIVGQPTLAGASPVHLLRTGLADWLLAADPQSQIASVSGKDRGAIHPVARARGQVYWFDATAGQFVTSTYYRSSYPQWVSQFNSVTLPRYRADSVWASTIPGTALGRTDPDTSAAEADGIHSYFPHRFADEATPLGFWAWFSSVPTLDSATLDFAQTMVTSLGLGRDSHPDYLNVSLSATDRVGHGYSPLSREQLDNLLRLDRELGAFFSFLDSSVGKGRWAVALSADHGALDSPEDLLARGEYGHRVTPAERAQLDSIRADADRHAADTATPAHTVAELKKMAIVADAYTDQQLLRGQPADSFAVLFQRSTYPGREDFDFGRQGVQVRYRDGVLFLPKGSSHGSTYWHDRTVPLIFLGGGIPSGRDRTRVSTLDFAPTFAKLLGIPYPNDLDGKALTIVTGR